MKRTVTFAISIAASFLGMPGCGGAKPPTDATFVERASTASALDAAPTSFSSASADSSPPASAAAAGVSPTAEATPAAPPASAPEPQDLHVVEMMLAPAVAFMVSYGDSAPKRASETTCNAKAGDDAARAACMDKERARFLADVLVFRRGAKGVFWTIYRRQGNSLQEISKSEIELGDEAGGSVHVKIKSDRGARPLFVGKKDLTIAAVSDSTLEIEDPRLGKLIYEARIGLVSEPSG